MKLPFIFSLPLTAFLLGIASAAAAADSPDGIAFFEKQIRPVLADKCYSCHSAAEGKSKGGLTLDTRGGMRAGGESGSALVPGKPGESLLVEALHWKDEDLAMPPEKSGGKLPDRVIADFEKWIAMGAPDPRTEEAAKPAAFEQAKDWWAFQRIQNPATPAVKNQAWPRGDLDRHVIAAQEARGLSPSPDAAPADLLRRLYFDLTGLPPGEREVEEFLKDPSAANYEAAVDRLLESPAFGERWGRHWLDVARYAESSGKEANMAFPHAWRYRDYVVAAFHDDKPFDAFIREQIAGDLLAAEDADARAAQLVATGFLAIGPKGLNEQNPRQFALDTADEQIDAVTQAFLGVTVSCARCHDHKFDPVSQEEYYALAGIFLSTETCYGTAGSVQNRRAAELIDLPADAQNRIASRGMSAEEYERKAKRLADLKADRDESIRERFTMGRRGRGQAAPLDPKEQRERLQQIAQIGALEAELRTVEAGGEAKAVAMGARDLPAPQERPRRPGDFLRQRIEARFGRAPEFAAIGDSALYTRGEADKPAHKVPRRAPEALSPEALAPIPAGESGRRQLADWIASPQNPLTARVMANRVWHWLFGRGIVATVDNFGTTGATPSNPELLDYLASRLIENGWSVKSLIREIALSHTYRQAAASHPGNFAADPENTLFWRANSRRLDAECLRDAMLAAAGLLSTERPAGSALAKAGDGPISGPLRFANKEKLVTDADGDFRSLYLPVARDVLPDSLAAFDAPESSVVTGARETTNVPSQALYLLNSAFAERTAEAMAKRLIDAHPTRGGNARDAAMARIDLAYRLAFGRLPDLGERTAAEEFFRAAKPDHLPESRRGSRQVVLPTKSADAELSLWTSYCRALFGTAEFRYLR